MAYCLTAATVYPLGENARAPTLSHTKPQSFFLRAGRLEDMAGAVITRPATLELIDPAFQNDAAIERLGREMLGSLSDGSRFSRLGVDILGQELGLQLLSAHSNLANALSRSLRSPPPARAAWRVRRAIDQLEAGLAEVVGLAELAVTVGLLPRHLSELFRAANGQRRINPAYIVAWSLSRSAHQAAAQKAHIKSKSQLHC